MENLTLVGVDPVVLTLGRQQREHVYRLIQPSLQPPVPEKFCLAVSTRIDASGELLKTADEAELAQLKVKT